MMLVLNDIKIMHHQRRSYNKILKNLSVSEDTFK